MSIIPISSFEFFNNNENSFFSKLLIKYPKNLFNKLILTFSLSLLSLSLFLSLLFFLLFLSLLFISKNFIVTSYKLFISKILYFNSLTSLVDKESKSIYPKKFVIYLFVS